MDFVSIFEPRELNSDLSAFVLVALERFVKTFAASALRLAAGVELFDTTEGFEAFVEATAFVTLPIVWLSMLIALIVPAALFVPVFAYAL